MINEKMYGLGSRRSAIREIFEYAKRRASEIGRENVFDFSIGNPSVPAPACVDEAIGRILKETPSVELHGYTSAQGDKKCRDRIAANLNARFGADISGDDLYMTCGAAACLTVSIHALACPGDEFIVFAPYFAEYKVFVEGAGAKFTAIPAEKDTFLPDLEALQKAMNRSVKGIIINSPNNPTGVVYGEETVRKLARFLQEKEKEYGHPVYLISDEPYRELVYDEETKVPYIPRYYPDTLLCYSYSKSLSLPGERIGYIAVNPRAADAKALYAAVCGAGRVLGFVCAPALFQRVAAECDGKTADLGVYRRNRDLLYRGLTDLGFSCTYPDGAFYLFVKSPEPDADAFCERARKYELLFVSGEDFGCPGYVRIAYCVPTECIGRALPRFASLAAEYGLVKKG